MNETEYLLALLKSNKISQEDFKLLSKAITDPVASWKQHQLLIINPFRKIAGIHALIAGILLCILMSFFGMKARVYFPGVLDLLNASLIQNPLNGTTLSHLLYQNIIACTCLSLSFFFLSLACRQPGLRWIDFIGTIAFARFPYFFMVIFLCLYRGFHPEIMELSLENALKIELTPSYILFEIGITLCMIWQTMTYFYALKESSGLIGKKLWFVFIVGMLLAEITSSGYLRSLL